MHSAIHATRTRLPAAALAALLTGLVAIAVATLTGPAAAQTNFDGVIRFTDSGFQPGGPTVRAGSTVQFVNATSMPIAVTGTGSATFDSSPGCSETNTSSCLQPGQTFQQLLALAGRVDYQDRLSGRSGFIVVLDATSPLAPPLVTATQQQASSAAPPAASGNAADTTNASPATGLPRTGGTSLITVLGLGLAGAAALTLRLRRRA